MSAPRVEVDLDKLTHNARTLVGRLAVRGVGVTAVTKAALGSVQVAEALLAGGVDGLGDSRTANIARLRAGGVRARTTLLRAPMPSEVDAVVAVADVSLNTEPSVIARLSAAALRSGRHHDVVVMVELGDLREGVMPEDLAEVLRGTLVLRGTRVVGIGTNLACRSGVVPDRTNMAALDELVGVAEAELGRRLDIVSGGNSATLGWALDPASSGPGRVTDLRLGEAVLLGTDPLDRTPIPGLHTDAFTVVAEVIESKVKPSRPWGTIAQSAFGAVTPPVDRGPVRQAVLALGRQDVDHEGLRAPPGIVVLGASSDHLVVRADAPVDVGAEIAFVPDYSALVRAMTSPFVRTAFAARPSPVTA